MGVKVRMSIHRKIAWYVLTPLFVVVVVLVLFRISIVGENPLSQLGTAVGVTVAIAPNPYNTLAEQLKQKEIALQEREQTIQEAESEAQIKSQKGDRTLSYLLGVGGILLILILANFYLDWRRERLARL